MRKPAFCIFENKDTDQLRGKACFTLIVLPFGRAFLSWMTECRGRETDRRQFHTENVRQPYDVSTIISRQIKGCRKTVMQKLQDCPKTKRYVVRVPHCSRAFHGIFVTAL